MCHMSEIQKQILGSGHAECDLSHTLPPGGKAGVMEPENVSSRYLFSVYAPGVGCFCFRGGLSWGYVNTKDPHRYYQSSRS